MPNCLFCDMISGKIETDFVFEDEHFMVIKDIRPKANVHLLAIPKVHIENLLDVNETHAPLLGHMMITLKKIAKTQGIDSFRTIVNSGTGSGQEVFHLHFHLLGGGSLPHF